VTVAWGPFGVTIVTVKKSWLSDHDKTSHEVHVGEFAAMDEAVRQALVALGKEKADEHRHAVIVGPERDGARKREATVDHPDFGGDVHRTAVKKPKPLVTHDDDIAVADD
jgi:Arc/MetJ-type ribon-helix-helix transcriptional regulator